MAGPFSYSARSAQRLSTVVPELAAVFTAILDYYDHSILTGNRGRAAQQEAVHAGASKTPWPKSKHNVPCEGCGGDGRVSIKGHRGMATCNDCKGTGEAPGGLSRAIDAAPYPIDWNDRERFVFFAGHVIAAGKAMGVDIRWGGDWDGDKDLRDQTFMDLVHFELLG